VSLGDASRCGYCGFDPCADLWGRSVTCGEVQKRTL